MVLPGHSGFLRQLAHANHDSRDMAEKVRIKDKVLTRVPCQ